MSDISNIISVVIPVFNGGKTIWLLLDSLRRQIIRPFEVIVVDNNSTDLTKDVVRKWQIENPDFPLTIIDESRQGRTFARNKGAGIAKGDYIAFFDVDCVVHERWLLESMKVIEKIDAAVIGGVVAAYHPDNTVEKVLHFLHCPKALDDIAFKSIDQWDIMRGAIETNNVVIEKRAIEAVGGFDEGRYFCTGEDFDLFLRLCKAGEKLIGLHRNLVVFHQHRSNVKAMVRQVFGYGYSFAECVSVHFGTRLVLIGKQRKLSSGFPFGVWIRFSKAFVVMVILCFLAIFLPITYLLPPLFVFFLSFLRLWHNRFKKNGFTVKRSEQIEVVGIALLHKIALLSGHLWGSIKFKVFCL